MKIAAALIAAGLVCIGYRALAAESPKPHAIWLFQKPLANEPPDQQRIFVISQEYASKDDCIMALRRVRIMAKGASVKCLPKEE